MKILLAVLLSFVLFVFASSTLADVSDDKAASSVIVVGKGYLRGILVMTDGTNAVTLTTYDNRSAASGKKLHPTWIVTTAADDRAQFLPFAPGLVNYKDGIYVGASCTGTFSYIVYYDPQ